MFKRTFLTISLSLCMLNSASAHFVEKPLQLNAPDAFTPMFDDEVPATPSTTLTPSAESKQQTFSKKITTSAQDTAQTELSDNTPKKPTKTSKKAQPKSTTPAENKQQTFSKKITSTEQQDEQTPADLTDDTAEQTTQMEKDVQPKTELKDNHAPVETTNATSSATEKSTTNKTKTEKSKPKTKAKTKAKQESSTIEPTFTLEGLNTAEWSEDLSENALKAFTIKTQVLLDNAYTPVGVINGTQNERMSKAIRAFQIIHKLEKTGEMNQQTWKKLVSVQKNQPAFIQYTLTPADTNKTAYLASIPESDEEKAKLKSLNYTHVTEMLGEKFHIDETLLKELNPNAKFVKGEKIIVPNINNTLPEDIQKVIVMVNAQQIHLYNSKNQMVASLPITTDASTPNLSTNVVEIESNPKYKTLPAGVNSPIGNVRIVLNRLPYEFYGTDEPTAIASDNAVPLNKNTHLSNWDANRLAKALKAGTEVIFHNDNDLQ